jgi:hypothetical protein
MSWDAREYRAWASLDLVARAQIRDVINRDITTTAYSIANSQSQHPPLYYWLLSIIYRALPPGLGLDARVYLLGLLSVGVSALALSGIYQTLRLYLTETPSLLTLLTLAWYPNLLPFLARLTNDTLAMPLLVWGLYFCLRARESQRPRYIVAAGVLLSLACFTKTYALTMLPVYLLCAATNWRPRRFAWLNVFVAGLITALTLGAFFVFNLATTGHLIPLTEMRQTATLPLVTRLAAPFQIDPIWFAGGLAKGFWWVGYWSFVTPSWLFFLPLAAPLALLWLRPHSAGTRRFGLGLRALWPHYAALAFFGAGMLWHAALFTLEARLIGLERHSGNEGWYANVLLGSLAVIVSVLLQSRLSAAAFRRVLAVSTLFLIAWNALALAAMVVYWGGAAEVSGRLRVVLWEQFVPGLLDTQTWTNWLSLPGVLRLWALTGLLPHLLAVAGTFLVLRLLTRGKAADVPT